jgi:hypothetical protein
MNLLRGNDGEHVRRNPSDMPGKLRTGGDLTGDEEMQAEMWDELIAESEGEVDSRIDEVGNAQDAILSGTGDLDHVHRRAKDESRREHLSAEDSPRLVNPEANRDEAADEQERG